jgi:hypothetical protein
MKTILYYQFKPKTALILISGLLLLMFTIMLALGIASATDSKSWASPAQTITSLACILPPTGYLLWISKTLVEKLKKAK